jgi:DNA-binding response OmpR family regulator
MKVPARVIDPKAQPEMTPSGAYRLAQAAAGTVLLIDDDPNALDLLSRYLTKEGFSVATAGGGEEGLRLARELKPVAITLDVKMPDLDGWSVLSALKGDPAVASIPVVVVSMVDEKTTGYQLGAAAYLPKPVDHERLAALLREYRNAAAQPHPA